VLALVARRFRVLSDRCGFRSSTPSTTRELAVGEVVERTGLPQATVSKHLLHLHAAGFLSRRREGLFVYYVLADQDVLRLCQMVCGRLADETDEVRALLALR
jgi:DNA-binding IclR family transcriptional regulator